MSEIKVCMEELIKCKDLCHKFNNVAPLDVEMQQKIFKEIVPNVGNKFVVTAPFWCDFGKNITIGNDFYSNHNLVILDGAKVSIGNNVFIAPNCCISTATHPIDYKTRNTGLEFAYPIVIGDNVWIGANVSILPGVTIGSNTVIGAGSVVVKDIPSDCVAVGSPCIKIRDISENDK